MMQIFLRCGKRYPYTSLFSSCCFQSTKPNKQKKFFDPDVFGFVQNSHKLAQNGDVSNDFQDLLSMAKQELTDEHLKCAKYIFKIAKQSQISLEHNMFASLPRASLFEESSDNSTANLFYSGQSNSKQCLMEELDLSANEQFYWSLVYQYCRSLESASLFESKFGLTKEEVTKELKDFGVLQMTEDGKSFCINKKALLGKHKIWAIKNVNDRKRKNRQKQDPLQDVIKDKLGSRCLNFLGQQKVNEITNHRLIAAKQFGQPLVFDMRFKKDVVLKPSHVADQILYGQAYNKVSPNPFHIVYCNADSSSPWMKKITNSAMDPELSCTVTEKSYLDMDDLLPREKLVYLSPDANQTMTSFSHEKMYIIGGLVDSTYQKNLTKMLAETEQIQCEKLPLKIYLNWGGVSGREGLSLDVVVRILVTLKHTNSDWIQALQHVPARFHRGLSEYGMQCVNYDEEILLQFAKGKFWFDKHKREQCEAKNNILNPFSLYLGR